MGKFTSSSQESRDLYKNSPYINAYRSADAFIVSSYATRFLINVFISINKPNIPSKAFTEEEPAIEWLKSISLE
jgi:dTDP-D-glucose 4,6-dehydratase